MYTIRNILYSIMKYRYVHIQWTFCELLKDRYNIKLVFIYVCSLLLTLRV